MSQLETVNDLLNALGEAHGWRTSYRIAKELNVPESTVGSWRRGDRTPGDDHALKIAEALEISPALVLTICAAERSTEKKAREMWRELARQLARGVVPTFAALLISAGIFSMNSDASAEGQCASSVYSVKRRKKGQDAAPATAAA